MAEGSYRGNTAWRTISVEEDTDSRGIDTLVVVRSGDLTTMATENSTWTRGKIGTSLGYPNMYLQRKRNSTGGRSNFGTITLEFAGFIGTTLDNPVSVEDSISLQAATLLSSEVGADGNATNVQVKYYAQTTTTRWIFSGQSAPNNPRYKTTVNSNISANTIFDPYPANYNGTLLYKAIGRLVQFERVELAKNAWAVSESWMSRVEPAD